MRVGSYVLYAVSAHLRSPSTAGRRFLTEIAKAPESPLAVAWAINFFLTEQAASQRAIEHFRRQVQIGVFPDGAGLPLWLSELQLRPYVSLSELARPGPVPDAALVSGIEWLDDQSQVEIILALRGFKVSRLTLALKDAVELQRILGVPLVCGSHLVEAQRDPALPYFSNLAVKLPIATGDIQKLGSEQAIDVYVSLDWRFAAICWALDRRDKAGEFLGIPECCRRWFSDNWQVCAEEFEGDLAFFCLKTWLKGGVVRIPAATNPYAVYLGGSLLGHFPCSPFCTATMAVAEKRKVGLSSVASGLLDRVLHRHTQEIWVSQFRTVSTCEPDNARGTWCRVAPMSW